HLGLGYDGGVVAGGQLRQLAARHAPAAVAQRAAERRLADDVAREAHGGGVKAGGQRDAAAFGFAARRRDVKVFVQHFAAAFVHDAPGGANSSVAVGGNVFFDKVDKTRFALQQAEQLQRSGVRRHG